MARLRRRVRTVRPDRDVVKSASGVHAYEKGYLSPKKIGVPEDDAESSSPGRLDLGQRRPRLGQHRHHCPATVGNLSGSVTLGAAGQRSSTTVGVSMVSTSSTLSMSAVVTWPEANGVTLLIGVSTGDERGPLVGTSALVTLPGGAKECCEGRSFSPRVVVRVPPGLPKTLVNRILRCAYESSGVSHDINVSRVDPPSHPGALRDPRRIATEGAPVDETTEASTRSCCAACPQTALLE